MSLHILIVDDDAHIGATLSGLLRDLGHHATACNSGEQALELIQREYFDLMFLDVWLPGMDGLAVLQRLQELGAMIPTIMISGHAEIDTAVKAVRLGAYNFLEKPLQPERIVLEVKNFGERRRLEQERNQLRQRLGGDGEMVGQSLPMQQLREAIRKAAPSEARVLIMGENGTGKELVAEAIHRQSRRAGAPFVRVNCAAIPRELIESELFGHERGAFTGATRRKIGLIEQAHTGTLFLDEIGDMSLDTQAKLLRVLQENELLRVGGTEPIRFDVRVIAATNKNIENEIQAGRFRDDLFFRLAVIPIQVPPLRERREDVVLLANYFLNQLAQAYGRRLKHLSPEAVTILENYHWPGNVRELRNIIERLMIMSDAEVITPEHVRQALPVFSLPVIGEKTAEPAVAQQTTLPVADTDDRLALRDRIENFERQLLQRVFQEVKGNVSEMARRLRTDRANLHRKLQRYNIKP
ncbi:MAG: sigma-54 dependent transcriptional regulator [candidate division KSB1 bacterium]|nr:sigma-54 dependent transcriptional regulator [candidate division KSB1 bacterium]MDZ7302800.1 sigma-54 dependent transcriptional regulator [candidate division KSB1 bacterium]MDZ7311817.1 sigma-54 dependent transcriptional regulator [candidate division KSB1 bacterium]